MNWFKSPSSLPPSLDSSFSPTGRDALLKLEGASAQWVEKFGVKLLQKVLEFTRCHPELPCDIFPEDEPDAALDRTITVNMHVHVHVHVHS